MHKHVLILALLCLAPVAQAQTPQRVNFPSHDGKTTLTGYLFLPAAQGRAPAQKRPAIVMMHGRAGAYSSRANGVYDASTLSRRHQAWGELWASQGMIALLVDGFGPRGYPAGFPSHSYDSRPETLNEVTVRPLDAMGRSRISARARTWMARASRCKAGRTAAAPRSPRWRRARASCPPRNKVRGRARVLSRVRPEGCVPGRGLQAFCRLCRVSKLCVAPDRA